MPRVSRHSVEFEAGGLWYRADFMHQHVRTLTTKRSFVSKPGTTVTVETVQEDPKGLPNMIHQVRGEGGRILRVFPQRIRHYTRCVISLRDSESVWGEGISKCSMDDRYDWRVGVDLAFQRAMDDSIPEMKHHQLEMRQSFYFHMGQKIEKIPAKATLVVTPAPAIPPVGVPGRTLPRVPVQDLEPITLAGFVPVNRNGVNLLLPAGRAHEIIGREVDPKALPHNGDDFIEGVVIGGPTGSDVSDDVPAGGA